MLKEKYFHQVLSNNIKVNRELLAIREFSTIKQVGSYIDYYPTNNINKKFVDLGCGDKHLENVVITNGFKYVGLDINDINFESDKFPLEDNSIEIVVSLAVLEHIHDPNNFLTECYRILKPGGLIFLSTPNFALCYKFFYDDPTHVRAYTPKSLKTLLEIFNFKKVDIFPALRCKPKWYYTGRNRFFKASKLLPFRGDNKYAPKFLKGKTLGIFGVGIKK